MTTDKQQRKERPIARGVLDYFPDAIAEVANVSYIGNKQHNGDSEMHWSRGKSADHADCIARHLIERGTMDTDGLRHSAKTAWRALALLQIEIEDAFKGRLQQAAKDNGIRLLRTDNGQRITDTPQAAQSPLARSCQDLCNGGAKREANFLKPLAAQIADHWKGVDLTPKLDHQKFFDRPERERDFKELIRLGCPDQVARQIVGGTTYGVSGPFNTPATDYVYLAGPMRNIPQSNFPAFDQARDELVKRGFNVISPADIDRHAGDTDDKANHATDQRTYAFRDFWALYFIAQINGSGNAIVLLRNWEKSTGATAEYGIAKWLGLNLREFDRDFPPKIEAEKFYTKGQYFSGLRYRLRDQGAECETTGRGDWVPSRNYHTPEAFNTAIQKGELIPCESASCPNDGNPSSDTKGTTKSATAGG